MNQSFRLSLGFRGLRLGLMAVTAFCLGTQAMNAAAQAYPSRPIRMIIPFPPGGSNDILGRFLAQRLSDKLGQQVLADNRAGADGLIGSEIAARATPDGYTILIISTTYTMNPALHKMPFDPIKSLIPISFIANGALAFYVAPNSPINNVKDIIAMSRAKPDSLHFATSGIGGIPHFSGAMFGSMAGIKWVHVPYKGGAPSMVDVMSGQVEVGVGTIIQALPLIRAGKLRAVAVTTAKRAAILPDVPTIAESGVAGYDSGTYWGVLGPAGIPRPIVTRLNTEISGILQEPEFIKRLQNEAADPIVASPDVFGKVIATDVQKWVKIAKEIGIKAE